MELKLAKSCGSCIHTSKPKKPREHAAHYEIAKTERWCFKHHINVTRECTCDDHQGTNRAAKTSFTRITNFNERLEKIKKIANLIGDKTIKIGDYNFLLVDGILHKHYNSNWGTDNKNRVSSKSVSDKRHIDELLELLTSNQF
jgi:hypothetical protein